MSRLVVLAAVLGVLGTAALAGCAAPEAGKAVADPAALRTAETPLLGEQAFGVAANVDPCSVVDVDSVTGLTNVVTDEPDGLDDCPVEGADRRGVSVFLTVGPIVTDDVVDLSGTRTVASLARSLLVEVGDPDADGYCDAYLLFPDGYALDVTASPADSLGVEADVCGAAVALARNAGRQVLAGTVTHRAFPPGSVGGTDACGLVSAAIRHASGLPSLDTLRYPEDHECYWASTDYSQPTLQLRFDVGPEPKATGSGERTVTVAGRGTVVTSVSQDGDELCTAETGLNTYTDAVTGPGDGLVEIATLIVDVVPGPPFDACTLVKAVAARVWPELPTGAH